MPSTSSRLWPSCPLTVSDLAASLVEQLVREFADAWERGQRPLAEDFLARHPGLAEQPDAVAELVYEEVCQRELHGEPLATATLLERFPRWRAQLEVMLDCREMFEPVRAPLFPVVGERYGEFQLRAELGRGGAGVVFLATQPALAERPVVLKLTRCTGSEHLRLARLQHTHIVPLYSVHDDAARGVRALCMPSFGGASLSRLLAALDHLPLGQRTGKDIVQALDAVQTGLPQTTPAQGPCRQMLERLSYVQALCWIGSCLASALQYAHEHGLVHLDLKPANVLLTADGQPMLLDFHLARAPLPAGSPTCEGLGGTPDYMAPEQQQALSAILSGRPIPATFDARTDVYALGVLLALALGGVRPVAGSSARSLRQHNPAISPGLADILARCLARAPADRYQEAATLASDLQRHLRDQPLRGVRNRSLRERWHKWRRRRPFVLPLSLGLCSLLVLAGATAWAFYQSDLNEARSALAEGKRRLDEGRYAEAAPVVERGLRRAEPLLFHADLVTALHEQAQRAHAGLAAAEKTRLANELHRLAEQARLLLGQDDVPPAAARTLEAACGSLWQRRSQLLDQLAEPGSPQAATVREDLLDLALLWCDLRFTLAAAPDRDAVGRAALAVLNQAEEAFGPSLALEHRREVFARAVGLPDVAQAAAQRRATQTPRSAWDHVALGRSLLEAGAPREALPHFALALQQQPENLWPNYYQGLACAQLGDDQSAVVHFSVCIGLAPHQARCYFNRGCARARSGQHTQALEDFTRALQLEPPLAVAALQRGRCHRELAHYPEALRDFQEALNGGVSPALVQHEIARVTGAQGTRDRDRH